MNDYESLYVIMHVFRPYCDHWSVARHASVIMIILYFSERWDDMLSFDMLFLVFQSVLRISRTIFLTNWYVTAVAWLILYRGAIRLIFHISFPVDMNKINEKESMAFVLDLVANCYQSRMNDYESLYVILHIFRPCCDHWSVMCNASMSMTYFLFFLKDEMICFHLI